MFEECVRLSGAVQVWILAFRIADSTFSISTTGIKNIITSLLFWIEHKARRYVRPVMYLLKKLF